MKNSIENNKLIAEFMGYKIVSKVNHHPIYKIPNLSYDVPDFDNRTMETVDTFSPYFDDMKFNTDWSWLMPVVEKINDLNNVVKIEENSVEITNNERGKLLVAVVAGSMFEAIYEACLLFIKQHNLKTK